MKDNSGGYSIDASGGYGADLGLSGGPSTSGVDLGFDPNYSIDAFGGYGTNLGQGFGTDLGYSPDYSMDAFGGYGTDFGLANSGASDYFGTDYDGAGFSSVGGNFGVPGGSGSFMDEISKFSRSPLGRVMSMTPVGKALGLANVVGSLSKGQYGPAVGMGVSALTGNPLAGTVANIGTQAAQGQNVAGPVGATIGGLFGGQAAGPVGGMVGSQIGGMVGQSVGSGKGSQSTGVNSGSQGMDFGGALANIADVYSANRASRDIGRNISAMQASSPQVSLDALYGPTSPYAAQLRQRLEREDAAAGRRTQYGPREVELQARLADAYSRAAPQFVQANTQNMTAIAQQQALQAQRRNQTLASIYGLVRNTGVLRGIENTFRTPGINGNLDYINSIVPDNSLNGYISDSYREYM